VKEKVAKSSLRNRIIVEEYMNNRDTYGKTIIFAVNQLHCRTLQKAFADAGISNDQCRYAISDENENIIWEIQNTWFDERIVRIRKREYINYNEDTENYIEYLAEYEYDSNGNRVTERNYKDGDLERVVRTQGSQDIEELYMFDTIVLQAVWEDGRKISETRR
jgi:hypothetical protein